PRVLKLLARLRSPGVDLPPRPLQAPRLLEEPVRIGRKAQARIDADPYTPAGVVWIRQLNLFRSRGMWTERSEVPLARLHVVEARSHPRSLIERGGCRFDRRRRR